MKIIAGIILIIIIYLIWQKIELTKFNVTHFEAGTSKLTKEIRAVVIADLHSHVYGEKNERLLAAVKTEEPDLILVPGDMIVGNHVEDYPVSLELFRELVKIAPVYFSNGNHESRPTLEERSYSGEFLNYQKEVEKAGVTILNNCCADLTVRGDRIRIYGTEIPLSCYEKGKRTTLPENFLKNNLGEPDSSLFTVLLAHNPAYAPQYAGWGADLTVSGHTHGGLVRIPGIGSLISPQFELFPKYDAGEYDFQGKKVLVSKGLGTHTFHIRIFDRAELLSVVLKPQ